MSVLALDFDGVLCDSARETGISGWKAGAALWSDMAQPRPPEVLLDAYCRARPVIETGYEAILMMRLLKDGGDPDRLLEAFPRLLPEAIARSGSDAAGLKDLYSAVRDRWMREDRDEWLSLSPLYPGAADFLNGLPADRDCYIVTTKQERYVASLLAHHGVGFPPACIFGLDRQLATGKKKEAVLGEILRRHPGGRIHFVEDRLGTLQRFLARPELAPVRLHLACWGYNTASERRQAERLKIHLLRALTLAEIEHAEYQSDQ